jgi:hypothetical protein
VGGYVTDGGLLVFTHKAAVTFDICTEDCGELTFEVLRGHASISLSIEDKLARSVSFSVPMAVQVQKYDRLRMRQNGRI